MPAPAVPLADLSSGIPDDPLEDAADAFVANVSHELRTPLTSIAGALALLEEGTAGPLPPAARRLVAIARRNARRLDGLVADLLDISRARGGDLAVGHPEPLDLADLAREAVEHNQPLAAAAGVGLVLAPARGPVAILGDPGRLLQVADNLISNAVKHAPRGSKVTVAARARPGAARLTVADRGPGIPEAFRDRIFQRFARAEAADGQGRPGTGLGLAIARAVVERHGGRITFDSAPGEGTRFHVDLPLAAGPAGA